MIFSQMSKTAIKSVIFIASQETEKATIKSIAIEVNESEHTIGKILQTLTKHGIILSTKGVKGGFYMTEKQLKTSILAVVHAIEGNERMNQCVLGLSNCSSAKPCPIHHEYQEAKKLLTEILSRNQINHLAQLVKDGTVNLTN